MPRRSQRGQKPAPTDTGKVTSFAALADARDVIRRISELRDLCRELARAGYRAGLHSYNPDQLAKAKTVREDGRLYRAGH
jgi:hypothetical protein